MSDKLKNTIIILLLGSTSFFYWLSHANAVVADDFIDSCAPLIYGSETNA